MRRTPALLAVCVLVLAGCSSAETSDTTTSSIFFFFMFGRTSSSTPTTTTTTVPGTPTQQVLFDETGRLPDGVLVFDLATSPQGMVAVGWFDKVPGVSGVRPAILTSSDGFTWETVNLDAYVLDTDFLDPTGVVWTGDEFIVVTEGTSLGVSGVLLSSPDGVSWSRTTLEVDVLDTAATRGNRAATLLWTPELIQSAGNVGLASIDMAGDVIVIGGWARLGTEPTPLIWTSSDGDAWAVRELPGTREIVRSIDAGPGAIAAFGLGQGPGGGLYDIMWVSENLAQWERYEYDIQDLEFVVKTAFGTNGHLIQATTYTSEGPRWWHSPDGSAWSPVDLPFDLVTTWHDRWVGVTCEGGGASISVSADHVTWTESGTIGRCPDRAVHDGDEPVFIDTEGNMWRRITDRWTTDDMVSAGARDTAAVVLVRHDDVLNVRTGAGVDNPVIGALDPQTRSVPLTGPT
ncbi:MAG: hypothetical protein HKO87_08885, partial [Acidimicrobiia bacterium]|nr:hypothetical protein [Acidimicrobiia bacterium]